VSLVEETKTVEDQEQSVEAPPAVEEAAAEEPQTPLPPLWRNRDYMLLWSGQVVSALGSNMSGIVFPLLILALTNNNKTLAGIAGALGSIPYLIFSLPVGALIDRWNRKRVMIICDTFRAVNMASIPIAMAFNSLTVWQLLVNSFIEGTFFVFFNIAEVASLSRVVNKRQLPQASAQNEAGFISASLIGPPIGAFLFQTVGRAIPFVFDAVSYSASVISLMFIKTPFQGERKVEERHLLVEIREGLSWLWHNPLIRFMAFLTGGYNFVNAATFLILIVLAKDLGATDAEIGFMVSIAALGGIVGSLLGGQIQKRFTFGQVIIALAWISSVIYALYLVAPNFILLGVISALSWMVGPIYNVVQFSYRLALIPDRLQGRVNSTFRLLAFGFQPLGSAIAGVLLTLIGTENTLMFYLAVMVFLSIMATLNTYVRKARPITEVGIVE
jgi:MFS family permease